MNQFTRAVTAAKGILAGETGLKVSVEELIQRRGMLTEEAAFQVDGDYWNAKAAERMPERRQPKLSVALTKLRAGKAEKLARAGAAATMQVELVSTHEQPGHLQQTVSNFVDAVCDVLERNQGSWGAGVFYAGGYDVEIAPVAKGGLNYVQSATISFEIHLWQE
jgi:hypothetical protein